LAIIINIDVMLAKRKMSVTELADRVGITIANISVLKNGKAKAIRLSTLEAICKALQCQPGDILEYEGQGHAGKPEDQRHVASRSLPPAAASAAGGQG
jgi:putative transcriptional regulator